MAQKVITLITRRSVEDWSKIDIAKRHPTLKGRELLRVFEVVLITGLHRNTVRRYVLRGIFEKAERTTVGS